MAKLGRRSLHDISGRDALLKSALHWFSRSGFEATSLRKIAQDAQVDVALVNRLFGSKLELWCSVVDVLKEKQDDSLVLLDRISEDDISSAKIKINKYIDLVVNVNFDTPELTSFILLEILTPGERLKYLQENLIQPFIGRSLSIINECNENHVISCTHSHLFVKMLLASISQLIDYEILYSGDVIEIGEMKAKILYDIKSVFIL
jgi:AcrR family transcriptional regulator